MNDFGDKLKKLRLARSLSISELSRMTGISRKTIAKWENPKIKASPSSFDDRKILAKIFNVSPISFNSEMEDMDLLKKNPVIADMLRRISNLEKR